MHAGQQKDALFHKDSSGVLYRGSKPGINKGTMKKLTFSQRRYLTVVSFSLRMVCMGIEYAVIFPTVWQYLKMFHVDYWYLGLVLSAYNMVGIVSTMIVGRVADSTKRVRLMGFFWNLFEVAGNFIYALHFNVSFPLLGRMVAGFGEGYISAMWGELAQVTTNEERTRYFTILKGANLLGAAIGPALNLFLKEFDFYIGEWHIDYRTSPGFFMGVVWIFMTALMLVWVWDLSSEIHSEPEYKALIEGESAAAAAADTCVQEKDEENDKEKSDEGENEAKEGLEEIKDESGPQSAPTFFTATKDMFTRLEVTVVVYLLFFMYVTHTCLQGITPLIAENMLYWDETKVSICFTLWGIEIILVLVVVWLASFRVSDRFIVLVSVICSSMGSIALVVLCYSEPGTDLCLYSFIVTIVLAGVGISVVVVVGRSLVSKHTKPENQGLVHAILTAINRLAGLSGPIFGSSSYNHKLIIGYFIAFIQILGLILMVIVYKKLEDPPGKEVIADDKK